MLKKTIFAIVLSFTVLSAGERIVRLNFNPDNVRLGNSKGYVTVSYEDNGYVNPFGAPMLPSKAVMVLVPSNSAYEGYEVLSVDTKSLGKGYRVMPQQKPVPISFKVPQEFIEPDSKIYSNNAFYPESPVKFTHVGNMSGFRLASFLVYPVIYNPVTGELKAITSISFRVKYEEGKRSVNPITVRQLGTVRNLLKSLVVNPQDIDAFAPPLKN